MTLEILYNSIQFISHKMTEERLALYEQKITITKDESSDQIMESDIEPITSKSLPQIETSSCLTEKKIER